LKEDEHEPGEPATDSLSALPEEWAETLSSAAYGSGSRGIKLTQADGKTEAKE
jgi:hypothetical protein